jgi:hypothetical protein
MHIFAPVVTKYEKIMSVCRYTVKVSGTDLVSYVSNHFLALEFLFAYYLIFSHVYLFVLCNSL